MRKKPVALPEESEQRAQLETRIQLTAVARGEAPADRFIRGATVVNVYSGELLAAHVALSQGHIAYVGRAESAIGPDTEVIDAAGCYLAPGWIEPHSHPWVLYNPVSLLEGILPGGTTQVFQDNLFFYLQAGAEGFQRVMEVLSDLPIRYRWLVRLISQSEWSGERVHFALEKLMPLLDRPEVAGTAEVTRWPLVVEGDTHILEGCQRARALRKRSDGHTAGASYEKLNAVAAGGITACHEAITEQEVLDRLRLGLWTMLRHSSLRPDLPQLIRAVTEQGVHTGRLMLTVDGPAPSFIAEHGCVDEALRLAVASGVPPIQAIQMATINPATYYRIDDQVGGIGPGRWADLVVLPDLEEFRPKRVLVGGRDVAIDNRLVVDLPSIDWDSLGMRPSFSPRLKDCVGKLYLPLRVEEQLPVIEFVNNVITQGGARQSWTSKGAVPQDLLLAVLADRGGQWMSRSWVRGFAPHLAALASTFNTTTHLLVMGRDPEAMQRASAWVIEQGGGIALASRERVTWKLELPIIGMMSPLSFTEVVEAQKELESHLQAAGFPYRDILYALLFLTCDFLPGWRLTARGILDVKKEELVQPAEKMMPTN